MTADTLHRFMLDNAQVRGEWVHLDTAWQDMLSRADYPAWVRTVLGEALTAAVLFSATLKHRGALILQIRGNGPLHLLVVQATPQGTVRGLAHWNREPDTAQAGLPELFGQGHIAITLEAPAGGERYQSIIPVEGDSLTTALEGYFNRSEQLPTRLRLYADEKVAAGLLLQRLPQSEVQADDGWERSGILLDTLTTAELAQLPPQTLLYRLFHEEAPRLFAPQPLHFHCGCTRDRVANMVRALGETEASTIVHEQGCMTVRCEFCNKEYRLDAVDVAQLFTTAMPASHQLH